MLTQILFYLSALSVWQSVEGIESWLTTADPSTGSAIKLLEKQSSNEFSKVPNKGSWPSIQYQINVDSKKQFILGYGAGLPQASAYVLNNLKNSNGDLYNSVMQKLFGVGDDGAAINVLRFPIGSCDFSLTNTTYDEVNGDYNLDNFAIDADSWNIVTILQDALAINPDLVVMGRLSKLL